MRRTPTLALVCLSVASGACVTVAQNAARPTALEHQLLGAYEELDEDLVRASSVRGDGASGPARLGVVRAQALEQRAVQQFLADDLAEFAAARCIAEALDATVVARPCPLVATDATIRTRRDRVVASESRARNILIWWAAHELAHKAGRSTPTGEELRDVAGAYRRLLRAALTPGHLVEVTPGHFEGVVK